MKSNTLQNIYSAQKKYIAFILALSVIFFAGCSKENNLELAPVKVEKGDALFSLNLSGSGQTTEDIGLKQKNPNALNANSLLVQEAVFPVNNGMHMEVKLEDKTSENYFKSDKITTKNTVGEGEKKMAGLSTTALKPNTKYRMVIYDENGTYLTTKDYVYGNEATTAGVPLDAGKKYSFIIYSINSTSATTPDISYGSNPSKYENAKLSAVSSDLMVFTAKDVMMNYGPNRLNAVMVHKFSEITTTLSAAQDMAAGISTLGLSTIGQVHQNADYSFSSGTITYNGAGNYQLPVAFPAIPSVLRSVTSTPTIVVNDAVTDRVLTLNNLTIDDLTKPTVSIPGIKVTPGHKYNLILTFKTCTQEVVSQNIIRPNSTGVADHTILRDTITAPASDYGFVFDIYRLDNSFNMKINGTLLFSDADGESSQIQFQNDWDQLANVEFADGVQYGSWVAPPRNGNQIWGILGTAAAPAVRLIISKNGHVSLLGSKDTGTPLVPLRMKSGNLNNVTWSPSGSNQVIITQKVQGNTVINAKGYGRKKIPCPTNP